MSHVVVRFSTSCSRFFKKFPIISQKVAQKTNKSCFLHREPTQSACVADCYFIVNVLDLPFASPIAIYR